MSEHKLKTSLDYKLAGARVDLSIARQNYEINLAAALERAEREHRYRLETLGDRVAPYQLNNMHEQEVAKLKEELQATKDKSILEIRGRIESIKGELLKEHQVAQHELDKLVYPPVSDATARRMAQRLADAGSWEELNRVLNNARAAGDVEAVAWLEANSGPKVEELSARAPALHGQWENEWPLIVESSRRQRGGPELARMKAELAEVDATEGYANQHKTAQEFHDMANWLGMDEKYMPRPDREPEYIAPAPAPEGNA
jgi:hypothetical protein